MVKNDTNINRMNNHFWPQIIELKRLWHKLMEIYVHDWDRQKNVARINLLIWSPNPLPLVMLA